MDDEIIELREITDNLCHEFYDTQNLENLRFEVNMTIFASFISIHKRLKHKLRIATSKREKQEVKFAKDTLIIDYDADGTQIDIFEIEALVNDLNIRELSRKEFEDQIYDFVEERSELLYGCYLTEDTDLKKNLTEFSKSVDLISNPLFYPDQTLINSLETELEELTSNLVSTIFDEEEPEDFLEPNLDVNAFKFAMLLLFTKALIEHKVIT